MLAGLLPLVLLLPFAAKPVHIDDPLYLWVAQNILETPFDFFGFEANWWGFDEPFYLSQHNPPGAGYFFAFVALIAGWGEVKFHIAMAICASLFSVGTYVLSRSLTRRPLLATCVAVTTPMFVVSGTTLMTDIPMATAYVWAVALWIYGIKQNRHSLLFAAACCMALSPLFKYPGINVAPLLFAFTWMKTRRIGWWSLYFLIPIAVLCVYQMITIALYDVNHLTYALGTIVEFDVAPSMPIQYFLFTGTLFVGGSIVSALCFGSFLWSPRTVLIAVSVGTFLSLALSIGLRSEQEITPLLIGQGLLFFIGGIQIASLTVRDLAVRRDAEALLLFLWVAGTFVFATLINWSVTVRILLPMLAPVAILVARRFDELEDKGFHLPRPARTLPLVVSAAISLYVGWADYRLAAAAKTAANHYAEYAAASDATIYFQGHWGFQYYMQEQGMTYFKEETSPENGDLVVLPRLYAGSFSADPERFRMREDLALSLPLDCWAATLNKRRGAGFYSHNFGPLPYSFGAPPAETYTVMEVISGREQ